MNWLERFFLKRVFSWLCKRLDGHKTKLGGAGQILAGLSFIAMGISEGSYEKTIAGFALAGHGLKDIGLAGKFEKQTAALAVSDEEKRRLLP